MKTSNGKNLKINAALNVCKQLASVVFPLITFPYVTQTLGAECYGQVTFTASIITYISLIAGMGITNYAIREGSRLREDRSAFNNFINEIVTLNVVAMLFSYVILAMIIMYYHDVKTYRLLLLIQGISVFFGVIGCEWLNVIYEDYAYITIRYIAVQVIAVLLIRIAVKEPGDIYKYALISQFATVFANFSNIVHFRVRRGIGFKLVFRRSIFSHLKYVLLLFANAVSMLIYVNSDVTIIGVLCGNSAVGIYSVAVKIYTIVKQLLNAMLVVAVPKLARWTGKRQQDEVSGQLNELLSGLLVFLFPVIVGLFSLSGPIVLFLSGPEYETAETALRILAITLLFSTGVCFYSNLVLIPNNMENEILKATMISAAMNIILNLAFIPKFGFNVAAITTLFSEAFSMIYMFTVSRKVYSPSVLGSIIKSGISGLIVFACCYVIKGMQLDVNRTVIFAVAASALCWGVYWLLIKAVGRAKKLR